MAKQASVFISPEGADAVRNSAEVQAAILAEAQKIADRAMSMGCACDFDVQPGKKRAVAMVKTTDINSMRQNAKNNTLLKARGW